jgi:hypothetical protein
MVRVCRLELFVRLCRLRFVFWLGTEFGEAKDSNNAQQQGSYDQERGMVSAIVGCHRSLSVFLQNVSSSIKKQQTAYH